MPTINQILLFGGLTVLTNLPTSTCKLFNPLTNKFTPLHQKLTVDRCRHSSIYLPSLNRVLIAGGESTETISLSRFFGPALPSTELFDPVLRTLTSAAGMTSWRALFSLTLIPPSDHVLACGGNYLEMWSFSTWASVWQTTTLCEFFIP
ncbi:unnamed protein product [Rotaria magnacalcarata]|uniref:Uncharacterized protein n=1 Tax=Rotaria magnacalcarata TaxID=392030 RepID=A0A816H1K2_9BILA|nr:unnamed protein product [Rotaria magnacalcarata]CAF1682785.1 unnamed protein product [Rotaria magnacalcarata]CAF4146367.1 unnamed protein product [Rotaria magnacalcarata]CAF4217447.1 unnamed protein product [Rotaria magnacalcarata]